MKKIAVISILFLSFIPFSEKVLLKVNFQQGESIPVVASIKSTTTMMGMETVIDMDMDYTMINKSKKGELFQVENTFQHMHMDMGMGMLGSMTIDSDNLEELNELGEQGEQLKSMTAGLMKSTILYEVSETGEVTNASFDVPEGYDLQALDPESMKGNIEQSFMTFPKKPVKVGAKWTETRSFKNSIAFKAITTYEVVEILSDVVKLNVTAVLEAEDQEATDDVKVSNFKGTMNGETIVDIEHGIAKMASSTQNLSFEIEAMGQKIPTTAVNEIVLRAKL